MDELEFGSMINTHMGILKANALKFTKNLDDADDLVQDTLIKAFRFSEKFHPGTNLRGWLFMIMRNTFINTYHKISRSKSIVSSEEDISIHSLLYSAIENTSPSKMMLDDIQNAINRLPENYRYPFIRYFEGYKYGEIADELNIPLGTVKTHIHVARELLRKYLKTYKNVLGEN